MKTNSKIYIIHFKDGKKIVGKSLMDIHNKYTCNSNNTIAFDKFRYIINNDLYNTDKKYMHRGVEHEYKLNDIGFLGNADNITHNFWVYYKLGEPFSVFRNMRFNYSHFTDFDFGGKNRYVNQGMNAHAGFKKLLEFLEY